MVISYAIMASFITIDHAGRIVVPQALRRRLGLAPGSRLRVDVQGDRLVLDLEPADVVLREEDGFLVLATPLEGDVPDHREGRVERATKLAR